MPRDIHGSPRPFLIKVGCSEEHTHRTTVSVAPGLLWHPGAMMRRRLKTTPEYWRGKQQALSPGARPSTHLLNRRIAMTMSMMRMTARTGPVTHSISGSSCCWAGVTWTTISSE